MTSASIAGNLLMQEVSEFGDVTLRGAKIGGHVSMVSSKFAGKLDMGYASISGQLFMQEGAEFGDVVLRETKIGGQLSMVDSKFIGKLDMGSATIASSLLMHGGAEFRDVILRGAKVGGQLSMIGSIFKGELDMDGTSIARDLFMHEGAEFRDVTLRGAKIGGQLTMAGSKFAGILNMSSVSVTDSLFMSRGAEFRNVVLRGAKIGGQLAMVGSKFTGNIDMDSTSVGDSLLMSGVTAFGDVVLREAKIGGQLSIMDSTFMGGFTMESASVAGSVLATNAKFGEMLNIPFVDIGSNLDVRATTVEIVDLTGAKINGELRLGSSDMEEITWRHSRQRPKLILRNTQVTFLQDTKETWPDYLERELGGFTYKNFGGLGAEEQEIISDRDSKWFINWLEKDDSYSPHSYRHLSSVLRETGHEDIADAILFAGRERERRDSNLWQLKWWGLWALQIIVGYGYGMGNFRALFWAMVFVVVGFAVLRCKVKDRELGLWFSIDMLLPFIRLSERHYKSELQGWPRYYFFFHAIVGYVLTLFVIAGLSGLTE